MINDTGYGIKIVFQKSTTFLMYLSCILKTLKNSIWVVFKYYYKNISYYTACT